MKHIFFCLLLACLLACQKDRDISVSQESYALPGDQLFPEGIAYNSNTGIFYTGSTINGDVIQVDVQTGKSSLFASGAKQNRNDCRGMKLDVKKRLWICGGEENKVHVLGPDGNSIKSWDLKALHNSGFINDCVADKNDIYFTDSRVQKIYRANVAAVQPGDITEWLNFTDQQIPYATGFNANGAVLTPDGKYLIIVISNAGRLYRIDRNSKSIVEIKLNTPVTSGDGLWLEQNILYVSRNATGQIFPVRLNADVTEGLVGAGFGTNLNFNTTIAKAGDYFLVVNGQLNRRPSPANPSPPAPSLPFKVSRVAIP
ncbi:MAG: SMP-30/gluconolactonase/LRE family protein [Chitinophagaceae bacterium]